MVEGANSHKLVSPDNSHSFRHGFAVPPSSRRKAIWESRMSTHLIPGMPVLGNFADNQLVFAVGCVHFYHVADLVF